MTGMKQIAAILLACTALALHADPRDGLAARLDAHVKPYVEHNAFSGVVLLAKGDDVIFEKAYGMANYEFGVPNRPDTRFAIASISKRFTGLILLRLYAANKLSPEDRLSKWVADFPSADEITVEHLRVHRSGVRDPDKLRRTVRANRTTGEVVELLKSEPLGSKPGETYSYTTANYAILAHIIERVTGKPYQQVVQELIYQPAGMKDSGELITTAVVPRLASGYMPNPFGPGLAVCGFEDTSWKAGGGASYSTARDLHRYARAFYAKKLAPDFDPMTQQPHSEILGRKALSSSGGFPGASANLMMFPDDEVTVVVLSNNYASVAGSITRDVAAMYFGQEVSSPAVKLAVNPKSLDPRFLGSYEIEGRPWKLQIAMREGVPYLHWNEVRQSAMLRMDEDTWFSPLDWAQFHLRIGENGSVEGSFELPGSEPLALIPLPGS